MEPLSGLDATFLAMETPASRLHVAGILVLEPADDTTPSSAASPTGSPRAVRFEEVRDVVGERVRRVPRLLRRAIRAPLGLQRPVWDEQATIDVDAHVRRASVAPPGGRRELDALVGEVLSRPLPVDRPLWEMVVAEGLAEGRSAVIARLHHAILDGVSGATAMAAFLDLAPPEGEDPAADAGAEPPSSADDAAPGTAPTPPPPPMPPAPLPSPPSMWKYSAASLARLPEAPLALLRRSADAVVALGKQNRELASRGMAPPPAPFSAPRTSINGTVTGERQIATFCVPVGDLELVRRVLGRDDEAAAQGRGPTVNDVILTAVGGALRRYLEGCGGLPSRPLVALVPVSTRGPASVPSSRRAHVGNYVSGMLVELGTTVEDPSARLRAVAAASAVAKMQESAAGGDFLETLCQVVPPVFVSGFMHTASRLGLFDRVAPPANVVVSSVVVPDVTLWWAGHPVSAIYPAGPVADGIGLNVTSMTYKGVVHFGVVGCPRLVPDVDEIAVLLDDALAELVAAALDAPA